MDYAKFRLGQALLDDLYGSGRPDDHKRLDDLYGSGATIQKI